MLQRAAAKSEEFEINGYNKQSEENSYGNLTRKTAALVQNLMNFIIEEKCDNGVVLCELNGLQRRARILLEQN